MKWAIKKILLPILTCGLILSPLLTAADVTKTLIAQKNGNKKDWQTYSSDSNGFSVEFPVTPDHIQQKIDIPNSNLSIEYDTYVSEPSESVVYVVSVWHYPKEIDMSKPEVNLQDGFKGMLSALPNSKVVNMQMAKFQGFPSLEFHVKSEEIFFQGKLILVYNTLFQVFTVYKESEDMSTAYPRFIKSFKLINPEQHKVPTNGTKKLRI